MPSCDVSFLLSVLDQPRVVTGHAVHRGAPGLRHESIAPLATVSGGHRTGGGHLLRPATCPKRGFVSRRTERESVVRERFAAGDDRRAELCDVADARGQGPAVFAASSSPSGRRARPTQRDHWLVPRSRAHADAHTPLGVVGARLAPLARATSSSAAGDGWHASRLAASDNAGTCLGLVSARHAARQARAGSTRRG